jgi:hypothetical protein
VTVVEQPTAQHAILICFDGSQVARSAVRDAGAFFAGLEAPIKPAVLASVSHAVLQYSERPVLVVR